MSSDNRQHRRYAFEVALDLRSGGDSVQGRTSNLSRGGLCAVVDRPITAGIQLEISLALVFDEGSVSEPILLPARVVWCTPLGEGRFQIGTAFLPLVQAQLDYLVLFIRYLDEGNAIRLAEQPQPEIDPSSEDVDPFSS